MLEELYAYGLTPQQATELTLAEMASFLSARKKHELAQQKMLAQIGYSAGIIGSMALTKSRPRFEEIFSFPREQVAVDANLMKARMLVWAQNSNRVDRKNKNKGD